MSFWSFFKRANPLPRARRGDPLTPRARAEIRALTEAGPAADRTPLAAARPAQPRRPRTRPVLVAAVATLLVVAGVTIGGMVWWRDQTATDPAQTPTPTATPPPTPLEPLPTKVYLADGTELATFGGASGLGAEACIATRYPMVCVYVYQVLAADPFFGATAAEREAALAEGGFAVRTTIRPDFQDAAQAAVTGLAQATDPVIVTISEVQPGTGEIWAMAQNRSEYGADLAVGQTTAVYAVGTDMGGAAGFQAGTAFVPFTVAAALDQGIPPTYEIDSPGTIDLSNRTFPDCDGHPDALQTGPWFVSGGGGLIDLYTAAAQSANTYFAQLVLEVGPCAAAKMADAAGVQLANGMESLAFGDPAKVAQLQAEAEAAKAAGDDATWLDKVAEADTYSGFSAKPAVTFGVAEVTPLSMAGAYATFGARGKACTPSIVTSIDDRDGATVKDYRLGVDNCREAGKDAGQSGITAEVADGVNDVLKRVVTSGLGSYVRFPDGRDQGAMPGTTEYNDNVWTVTYTPEIAVAVNISADTDPPWTEFWDLNGDGQAQEDETTLLYRTLPSGRTLQGWSWLDPPVVVNAAVPPLIDQLPATPFTPPD